ncbi:MAG TPA: TIM44-like domain-containing protein [Casimicrobiaceae bacterium]
MNRLLTLTLAAAAACTLVAADFAEAKKMGGGRSFGAQRTMPAQPAPATPPSVAPSKASPTGPAADPVMPRQATPGAPTAAQPGAAAAAPKSGMSRWLGPVAGLAAGLGLAALASHLGIAEELMSVLLLVGIALVVFLVIRMVLARRAGPRPAVEYAGAPMGASTQPRGYETQVPPRAPEEAAPAGRATSPAMAPGGNVPAGFDTERFLREAKSQFARLQSAFDRGDRSALAEVMTPTMFAEIARELPAGPLAHPTEIVALNAELVEVATEAGEHWAGVRFRGLMREDGEPMPKPFDEMWNLVKPVDDSSGWMLAGIQQLEPAQAG